jgi:hypothetical protein
MLRTSLAAIALLAFSIGAQAQVRITWIGQTCFYVPTESGETEVVIGTEAAGYAVRFDSPATLLK